MKRLYVLLTVLSCSISSPLLGEQAVDMTQNNNTGRTDMTQNNVKNNKIKKSIRSAGTKIAKSIEKGKEKVMNLITKNKVAGPFTPDDFKFDELKKIDVSKCKKLEVKEIKTNFQQPVWFVKTEGSTVTVNIKFKNEGSRSFKDKPYLLTILYGCIKENVGNWGTGGFKQRLKDLAIDLDFDFDSDDVVVSFSCLAKYYDLALSLTCELMTQSLLPESDIERMKAEEIDKIKQSAVTPDHVASEKMSQLVNIKEYAWSFDEGLNNIPKYNRNDVVKCYKTLFDPRNAEITIVGNITEEQISSGINKVHEVIKDRHNEFAGGTQRTELVAPNEQYKHFEVENENATVLCALPGVAITDEDKYAIKVANRIWGNNGLSSRLFVDIREKQHLVYAIWSNIKSYDLQSRLEIRAKTSPQYIKAVITGIVKSCKELAEKGITEDELLEDRIGMVASHVLHSPSAIMSYVLARRADGATVSTVDEHLDKYAKLTVNDVNKALHKVFNVEKMVVVSAGKTVKQVDKAQIENVIPQQSQKEAVKPKNKEENSVKNEQINSNTKNDAATALPIKEAYLENGLRIVVCNMPCSKDAVFFGVGYYVGSGDDPRDIVGASHFLEHMAFKESKNIPAGKMDRCLSTFNNYTNAFTCEDITFYIQHCNKAFLDANLRLESERMGNAIFREETVKNETNVILAEREMRTESDPYTKYIEESLLKDIYLYSNYSNGVIGYRDQIKACNPENLKKHYDKFYKPNNAVAMFIGDITIEEATEICQRNFGHIKKGEDVKRERILDPEDIDICRIVTHKNPQIKQKRLSLIYKIPRKNITSVKQELILSMVNDMLFGSDSSIMRDKICSRLELAHNVRSYLQKGTYDFAYLSVEFDVNDLETQFSELEDKIDSTIKNFLRQKSPTDIKGRFEKLKQSFKHRYEQMHDDPDSMTWLLISSILIAQHSIDEVKNVFSILDSITFDEFMKTAEELLLPSRKILTVHFEPSENKNTN